MPQHQDPIVASTTASLLQEAVALHRQGALAEAEERYAQVLRSDPANADVLYRLAQISCQQGRLAEGVDFACRALAIDPGRAQAYLLLGMALARLDRPEEALASFDRAIALQPEFADDWTNVYQRWDSDAARRILRITFTTWPALSQRPEGVIKNRGIIG